MSAPATASEGSALDERPLSHEQLAAHAADLARAQGKPSLQVRARPLLETFRTIREGIEGVYRVLGQRPQQKTDLTPAEEWLLDNAHVIREQLREMQEDLPEGYLAKLPRLLSGPLAGHTRVYALASDFLAHTGSRVDLETLVVYVMAYQSVAALDVGELWAIPIMLRFGLVERVLRLAQEELARGAERARADDWARRTLTPEPHRGTDIVVALADLVHDGPPVDGPFLVQLLRVLREHDDIAAALAWIRARCAEMGTTPDEMTRREHLRQAESQLAIGNSITSMRAISALDWTTFFERTSTVEAALGEDPAGAYPRMDAASRDRYRHAVEDVARRTDLDETSVTKAALRLAAAHGGGGAPSHVGYYLVDEGRRELEAEVGYRPSPRDRVRRAVLRHATLSYLGAISGGAAAMIAPLVAYAHSRGGASPWLLGALALALVVPCSEIALAAVNWVVTAALPPRLLAKLSFEKGIPAEHRTLVVVPALIGSVEQVHELLEDLEVRSLANPDDNLHFALLTDFPDADVEERPEDAEVLAEARRGVAALNAREPDGRRDRYALLHRRRRYNEAEHRWMGWERKRGKLEELNRLVRAGEDGTFTVVTADRALLRSVRYVLTLDADTQLPRGVARRLAATMAHPLNRPQLDAKGTRVVRGYGVIQPRVGTTLASTAQSLFARVYGGRAGIDPYTTAVSDVYQDLFDGGVYCGKAIYDVAAFDASLAGCMPENRLLSHDLLEGLHAGAALATDIEVLDDQPSNYVTHAARQHRWVRGDWQLASWLLPWVPGRGGARRNRLDALSRWKILDNLRRSLIAPSLVALLLLGWLALPGTAAVWTAVALLVLSTPLFARLATAAVRPDAPQGSSVFLSLLWGDVRANLIQAALATTLLLDQAALMLDAIGRTLYRLVVRRNLLEWVTASDAERRASHEHRRPRRLLLAAAATLPIGVVVGVRAPEALPFALPLLLAWLVAPSVAEWISRPIPPPVHPVSDADRALLRRAAEKTWRFFETFVTEEEHWLPPDNYQQEPKGEIAHRTSPTNIGLYLLSTVAARDFGFVTLGEMSGRLESTLSTVESLELHAGHVLNWYETTNLKPLLPRYVSTVDSGNLAAHLWTVAQGLRELSDRPIVEATVLQSALDAALLLREEAAPERAKHPALAALSTALERALGAPPTTASGWLALLSELTRLAAPLEATDDAPPPKRGAPRVAYWTESILRRLRGGAADLRALAPWTGSPTPAALTKGSLAAHYAKLGEALDLVPVPAQLDARRTALLAQVSAVEEALAPEGAVTADERAAASTWLTTLRAEIGQATEHAVALGARLAAIGARATAVADGMRFRILYDEERKLFAIGYDVASARLDRSHYDLLASEARLASLVAIAKGEIPQEHWFRLGRQLVVAADRRALLSWSGSMFEYLMPLLCTRAYDRTLLDETYDAVIARQREYGAQQGIPWGVSESAYNLLDLKLVYQYSAFGVPGLGLKAGLAHEVVVAPYASALAALVHPAHATQNLRALAKEGLDGPYGFYDAIDFTPAHVPAGRRGVVVKVFMAHHQGMSLVAYDNVLNGDPMQRRFHLDPRVRATELLLQERVPPVTALTETTAAEGVPTTHVAEALAEVVDHVTSTTAPPRAHLLAYGELSVMISATGGGWMDWRGLDVTRFRADAALDRWGAFCYLRDLDSGAFWSAAYEPTRRRPDSYDAAFAADRVTLHRRDGDIETLTEIAVSPEHPAEVRRFTVTNHSATPRRIELTTYAEVVLAPRPSDAAHPVFSNMFVATEAVAGRDALLATRRPRSSGDVAVWAAHVMTVEEGRVGPLEIETDRARFVGRGRSLSAPLALVERAPLSGSTGAVLDPIFCLRRVLEIPAHGRVRVAVTTAVAGTREAALELCEIFHDPPAVARTFELAWTDARVELRHLGISATQAQLFQRLASAIVYPRRALRAPAELIAQNTQGQSALWRYGISGDLPIVLLRLDDSQSDDLVREMLLAHEMWRLNGLMVDLVLLNEEPGGYLQPVQEQTWAIVRSSPAHAQVDQPGGVYLRRADPMPEADRVLLQAAASVVLRSTEGSLARQLRRTLEAAPAPAAPFVPTSPASEPEPEPLPLLPTLASWNGLGGFGPGGREYVIALDGKTPTPAPWCNVIANPRCGFVVSERGASFTWTDNSQTHRLTPWSNDPVIDPSGEAIYLRDEESGTVWSPTPEPAGGGAAYVVRHGQGHTTFEHARGGIAHELTMFVAPEARVKIWRLRLTNKGQRARRLSVYGYVEWAFGRTRGGDLGTVTEIDPSAGAVLAHSPFSGFPERVAVFATGAVVRSATADRAEMLDAGGTRTRPAALAAATLSGAHGAGYDPCAALQVAVTLAPGASQDIVFVLGEGDTREEALQLARAYRAPAHAEETRLAAEARWDELLGAVQVETPDPMFDVLANRWLLYQALGCRMWARSAFYQSSGAFGFRDQLQDALAVLHAAPEIARAQILTSAARQFREGDVQHWWHPFTGQGVRTRYADDLVWLPYVVARYVEVTGDLGILEENVPFLEARMLEPNEAETFDTPKVSGEAATLYEHCTRALDRGATAGAHGLPKMGSGDWNDGMNHVGAKGEGESVWMAFFLAATLRAFEPLASGRGDRDRAARCDVELGRLAQAVDLGAWDGEWYRRAYFDDGTPLGSRENDECQIDSIAQSWAVIAGIGDPARARQAIRATDERLVKPDDGMILLFTPPFAHPRHDPGYIQAYPAGIRENGGQYTHGVLWTVLAHALLGDGDRAFALWSMLSPIRHAASPELVARYRVEPYVCAADVYSAPGLVGRGGWTWYTGSAAWMYRIAVESMLGLTRRGSTLAIAPSIPSSWPGYTVTYRFGGTHYRIAVENPSARSGGVSRIELDGVPSASDAIPLRDDGRDHEVRVVLGDAGALGAEASSPKPPTLPSRKTAA